MSCCTNLIAFGFHVIAVGLVGISIVESSFSFQIFVCYPLLTSLDFLSPNFPWFFSSDVTQVLFELELTIKRVKVSTTPDGRVMDLFFVTDTRLFSFYFL